MRRLSPIFALLCSPNALPLLSASVYTDSADFFSHRHPALCSSVMQDPFVEFRAGNFVQPPLLRISCAFTLRPLLQAAGSSPHPPFQTFTLSLQVLKPEPRADSLKFPSRLLRCFFDLFAVSIYPMSSSFRYPEPHRSQHHDDASSAAFQTAAFLQIALQLGHSPADFVVIRCKLLTICSPPSGHLPCPPAPPPSLRLTSVIARRANECEFVFAFICSGACASALRFKRAFAEEHHQDYPWCSLFLVNRL